MAAKDRVRMYCSSCRKNTVHEVRKEEGRESCVCLVCKGTRRESGNAALDWENRVREERSRAERLIEAERLRSMTPGG